MENQGLFYFFIGLTLFFTAVAALLFYKMKRMSDLRTLRLGRLGILYLANLFFAFNSLIAVGLIYRFSDHPTTLTNIGLIFLVIEMIMLLLFPMLFGFVLPISILILTIKMWRRESKSIANLILPILMFIFLVVDWLAIYVGDLSDQWIWLKVLFFAYPILSAYLAWHFMVYFLSSWIYGRQMRNQKAPFYVVLGAGLVQGEKVGVLLGNRIKAAVNAADEKTVLLFSGGQGPDEKIAESEAMQKYAIEELKFPKTRTMIENKSRTTFENLVFSAQIIKEESQQNSPKFLFFSSDYHVFRAALFAKSLDLQADGGRGGKTAMYYRVPAFIREFIAVLNTERKKHMIWVGLIVGGLIILAIGLEIMQKI